MITPHREIRRHRPGSILALARLFITAMLITASHIGLARAEAVGPLSQVRNTVDAVLAALRTPDRDVTAKRAHITRLIAERFDFDLMARQTLATNWRHASAEERRRFVQLFTRLLQATYLGRIEAYTNEKVEYRGERIKDRQALVETVILDGNTEIPVNYKLREEPDRSAWKVYDVVIEKVSLIATYRSDYREIVNKDGMTGLLALIEKKIRALEQGKTT